MVMSAQGRSRADLSALTFGKDLQGIPYTFAALPIIQRTCGRGTDIGCLRRNFTALPPAAAQPVKAEVHGYPVHPRLEFGLTRLPCACMLPDA